MSSEQSKPAAAPVVPGTWGIRETAIKYGFLMLLAGMVLYFSLVTGGLPPLKAQSSFCNPCRSPAFSPSA